MPRGKDYTQLDKLREMGVALAGDQEYLGFRVKHKLNCLVCEKGEWETSFQVVKQQYDKSGSTGCPVCKVGHTNKRNAKRRETYNVDARMEEAGVRLVGTFNGAMHKADVECLECGHRWQSTPSNIISGYQTKVAKGSERTHVCPACHQQEIEAKVVNVKSNNLAKLANLGYSVIGNLEFEKDDGRNTPMVTFLRHECDHMFDASLHNVLGQLTKCPICYKESLEEARSAKPKKRVLTEEEIAQLDDYAQYSYHVRLLTDIVKKQNASIIDPDKLRRGKSYGDDWVVDHRASVRACYYAGISIEEASSVDNLRLLQASENGTKSWKVYWDVIPPAFVDRIRANHHKIDPTQYLMDQLQANGVEFGELHRKTASYFYAFVANNIVFRVINVNRPDYWENQTLLKGMQYFNKLGYRVVQILDIEIKENPELIVSKVMNILGYNRSAIKVHARKLEVRVLDQESDKVELRELLENNHVQGDRSASVKIGGFWNGKLVAAMSFNRANKMTSNKAVGEHGWDLSRFVTDVNYSIPGAAGKLLKFFERNFDWTSIVSHADKRWSVGDLYQKLGFEMFDSGDPGYFYIMNGKKYSRNYFAKANLSKVVPDFDPKLPESHYADKLGAVKIYDCGVLTCLKVK